MAETLDLDKAIENAQEETPKIETPAVETPASEEKPAEEKPSGEEKPAGEEKPKEGEEKPAAKDEFADLVEGKDFLTLTDGRRIKTQELTDGYMRGEDYTHKNMELSEARRLHENDQHQLKLAQSQTNVETKEEKAVKGLIETSKEISDAFSQMDETDPMAIILKGMHNQIIENANTINQQIQKNQQLETDATTETDNTNATRLIKEALEKEEKNYNLPTIKGDNGEVTDMKSLWNQLVLTDLQAVTETLNLAQFNHRVSQIGKKAYAQLRTIISVANATKPKEEPAAGSEASPEGKKTTETTEKTPKSEVDKIAEKEKGLSLQKRLENALERRTQNK